MEPRTGAEGGLKQLHFRNRFRGATKGLPRPTISSMDWYKHKGEYDEMMALSTGDWIRAFGRQGTTWKMLANRKPTGIRKVNVLKRSPEKCSRLAVASTNGQHVTIDLLEFKNQSFKKLKRFEVPQASSASCLLWDITGKYLLAPMTRDSQFPEARILVFKILGRRRFSQKAIFPKYGSHFSAVFHPSSNLILSTSVSSSNIDVWTEETRNHDWVRTWRIPCIQGITDMCFGSVHEGFYIAAVVFKGLMIWKYCDRDEHGNGCNPRLELINHDNDDGIARRKDVSLLKHCNNILSLSWSREGLLLTGSTKGTMCVHELCDKEIETFKVVYFRWSHVHAQNIRGPVNCVSWIPAAKDHLMLALAGNDGVVIVWELLDPVFPNPHDRNYLKEINYFHPGRRSFVGEGAQEFDVASITSIMATQSDVGSDGKSVASDDDSASVSGNEKATPVNSRVRKVLESQEDIRSGMSDLLDGIQDIISRLSAIGQIADADNGMLSELTDSSKDAKENLDRIEGSVEKFSDELKALEAEIKGKRTALESAEAAGTQVVQKSMEMTEKLEMLLSEAKAIVTQLKSQHYNLDATLVRNKNHLEQTLTSKLWKLEDSIKTMFRSMEESANLKHRHLEQTITERLTHAEESMQAYLQAVEKENAERHTEVISRFDTIIELLKKSGNFPMHPTSEA